MRTEFIFTLLFIQLAFCSNTFSQGYSIRTNLFNLAAKGPSLTFGKYSKNNSQILFTYSTGHFSPFFREDYYKYSTLHIENSWESGFLLGGETYLGGYIRYINKRIITEGYTAGPYNLFSKESRNFIGNGISLGITNGIEWEINQSLLIDLNILLGAGKYVNQIDYAAHDKISMFLDTRIALQIGYRF